MTLDEIFKTIHFTSIPASDDEAIDRISTLCDISLHGLYKCLFKDMEQIRRCMFELKYITSFKAIMFSNGKEYNPEITQIITYRGEFKSMDGTIYEFLSNQTPNGCEIINIRLVKQGTLRPQEQWDSINKVLEPKKENI